MKIKVIKTDRVLNTLRPIIKIGDIFEVIAKSNTAKEPVDNPCYLIYDSNDQAISLYNHEVEEIEEIKPKTKTKKVKIENE